MENGDTTTHAHHILAVGETNRTIRQQATIIPVDLNLRHSDLSHVVASRIDQANVLSRRSTILQQHRRRSLNASRVGKLQSLERLMQDVASHITQSTCTVIPPSTPVPRMISLVERSHLSRTCKQIPVQSRRNLVSLLRSIQTLRPDRTVGCAINASYLTDLTILDPLRYQVSSLSRRTLVTHLSNNVRISLSQLRQQTSLVDRVSQRLLRINVLAQSHGVSRDDGVCMVSRSYQNSVD